MPTAATPRTLCLILGGGRGSRLYPLTRERSKPAVPLGGKYRLIDVPIGNCLNSGLNQIFVITQFLSESLHRHMQGSFQFDRFGSGFVEILAAQQTHESADWYQGTADAVRQNIVHLRDHGHEETLILSGDQLYRMDYRRLLAEHRRTKADVTIATLPVTAQECGGLGIVQVDRSGRIVGFREKPAPDQLEGLDTAPELFSHFGVAAPGRPYLASMGIYVFNTEVLLEELVKYRHVDFGKDLFPQDLQRRKLQAYVFDDYWEDIGTVKSFHEANLELARQPAKFEFRADEGPIYTRPRILPPTLAARLSAHDSIVTDGCTIAEAILENSVIGQRSLLGKNVRLVRTLMFGSDRYETAPQLHANAAQGRPNIGVGDNVTIENAILDKDVRIGSNVALRPPAGGDSEGSFYAVRDGVLCVFKGAVVPNGTRLA